MTGIITNTKVATAVLICQKCDTRWTSRTFELVKWGDETRAAIPAFEAGWRVFAGGRSQHTYCPEHAPTVPMRDVYGPDRLPR